MKKLAVIATILGTFTLATCTERDTNPAKRWPRRAEAWLSSQKEWSRWQPAPATARPRQTCREDPPATRAAALRLLEQRRECTPVVVEAMEQLALTDPAIWSDVAAIHYENSREPGRRTELLRAWTAARRAVESTPRSAAARFNLALVEEAIGLTEEAIASWAAVVAMQYPGWSGEAEAHRRRLQQNVDADGGKRWPINAARLPDALQRRDRQLVAELIESFPSSAQIYFEEELLPQWAEEPTAEHLGQAKLLAEVLSRRFAGSRFSLDAVAAIERASQEQRTALREGHRVLREARRQERTFAKTSYERASALFRGGGSPFWLLADLGHALSRNFQATDVTLLEPLLQHARNRQYRALLVRLLWMRAYFLERSRALDALTSYEAALAEARLLRDQERIVAIQARIADVHHGIGDLERAWSEALQALASIHTVVSTKEKFATRLAVTELALALGAPELADRYHSAAIDLVERDTVYRAHRAGAYRRRANIRMAMGDLPEALEDLKKARQYETATDPNVLRGQEALLFEIEGHVTAAMNQPRFAAAFQDALDRVRPDQHARRASLFAQRADAYRRKGDFPAARADLERALDELNRDQTIVLARRAMAEHDELWSAYFSRHADTHRLLMQLLLENGDPVRALQYAERSRAIEPLDLILDREDIPEAFRELVSGAFDLRSIQSRIPENTFVLQYAILEDRTVAWVLGRDHFSHHPLRVTRESVERWTLHIQDRRRDTEAMLRAAWDGLIRVPLASVTRAAAARPYRLVIVPDGAMYGLPFAALTDPLDNTEMRFLVQRAPIEIAGSTTLYLHSLRRDAELAPAASPSVLAIGNPRLDRTVTTWSLPDLPEAYAEAKDVSALYAPHSELLTGAGATADAFFARAPHHEVVHIAAHTLVNRFLPAKSTILLAPRGSHRGAIDGKELLTHLQLHRTRLIVLGTCRSAGGVPVGSEGVAPLVRPLLAANVPAVIGTLWDVQDDTARRLLVSFHRHYQGSDAAVALQKAQQELLRNNNTVYDWAAFQVIGHASSPRGTGRTNGGTPSGIHSSNSVQRSDRLHSQ